MTWSRRLLIISLLAVAGCGGGSGGTAPVDFDAFLDQFKIVLCTHDVACGKEPDVPTCRASLKVDGTDFETLRADIASGKVRYDSAKAGACIDYWVRIYGGPCTLSALAVIDQTVGSDACNEFLVGSADEGAACFSPFECANATCALADATCERARQCCPGTCVAATDKPAPVPVGGDCSALLPGQSCVTGASCLSTDGQTSPTCYLPSKVKGAACVMWYECAPPLFCALDAPGGTRTCQEPAATGAPCNTDVSSGACNDLRDYCDGTGKCARLHAAGAPCDVVQQNCIGYADCRGSACIAKSPERGACDATNGPYCLGNLVCSPQTFTCGFADFVSGPCS